MKKIILLLVLLVSLGCLVLVMRFGLSGDSTKNVTAPDVEVQTQKTEVTMQPAEPTAVPTSQVVAVQDTVNPVGEPEESKTEDVIERDYKIVVLDPGHGGKFAGACYKGIQEKDISLKVANYCRAYLLEHYDGIEVYLTRETDIALDNDIKIELEKRAEYAKELDADAFVSFHFNSMESHLGEGTEIFCSRRENVKDATFDLGEAIMSELMQLGLSRRGVMSKKSNDMFDEDGVPYDYYAINRHCAARDIPGVIIEHCFMDNVNDQKYIESEEALERLGIADAKGIATYFELTEKSE